MRKVGFTLTVFFLISLLAACQGQNAPPAAPSATPIQQKVVIYLFWGDGCPHCAAVKPFLNSLVQQNPSVELRAYEVWYVDKNQDLFEKMGASYGFEPHLVPTILIGNQFWEGYSEKIAQEIETAVKSCQENGCPDPGVVAGLQE